MLIGIEGFPGAGKSTLMAWMANDDVKRNRPICCNKPMRGADHVPDFHKILLWAAEHHDGTVYIEEAGVFFRGRGREVPIEILDMAAQARHRGLDIVLNYQHKLQLDPDIYRLQQVIYTCRKLFAGIPAPWGGYLAAPIFQFVARDPATGEAMWGNTPVVDWRIWRPDTLIYDRVLVRKSHDTEAQLKATARAFTSVVNDDVETRNLR